MLLLVLPNGNADFMNIFSMFNSKLIQLQSYYNSLKELILPKAFYLVDKTDLWIVLQN